MSGFIEIIPLFGIRIGEKTVTLGEPKGGVERDLGLPSFSNEHRCSFFEGALRVNISEFGLVEAIAFPFGAHSELLPTVYGKSVFGDNADEITALFKEKNGGDFRTDEDGYFYCFHMLGVRLTRDTVPKDVEKMIRMTEGTKNPMRPEDIAFEMNRAVHWELIEIAEKGYYSVPPASSVLSP